MESFASVIAHEFSIDDETQILTRAYDEFVRVGVATAVAYTVLPGLDWKTQREAI